MNSNILYSIALVLMVSSCFSNKETARVTTNFSCTIDSVKVGFDTYTIADSTEIWMLLDEFVCDFEGKKDEIGVKEIAPSFITIFPYKKEGRQKLKISSSQSYNMHFAEIEASNSFNAYPTLGVLWHKGYLIKLEGDEKSFANLNQVTKGAFKKAGGITSIVLYPLYDQNRVACIDTMLDFKRFFEFKKEGLEMFFSDI